MAITTFPLDNVEYFANAPGSWLATRTRGVFAADRDYKTTANGNMSVTVSGGIAWLKYAEYYGVSVYNDTPATLQITTADGTNPRIDAVVLKLDKIENGSLLEIRKGTPLANPTAPAPVRDANTDEIILAHIRVPAAVLAIGPEHITDKRMDEAVCGLMRDGVTGLPTSSLQASAEAVLQQIRDEYKAVNDGSAWLTKTDYHPDTGATPLQPKTDNALTTAAKTIVGAISELLSAITGHKNDKANPHAVTKAQVGLGNVDNTADAAKTVSRAKGFLSSAGDLGEVVVDTTTHYAWWLPYSGSGSYGGTRKIFAALHADDAQSLTGKSLTMTLSGSTLNVTWG